MGERGVRVLYAQRAAGTLKVRDTSPKITASVGLAAIPLNGWPNTTGVAGGSDGAGGTDESGGTAGETKADRATETYGYAASLALARSIADRAGDDAMRRVWAAASGASAPTSRARRGSPGRSAARRRSRPRPSMGRRTGAGCSTCSRRDGQGLHRPVAPVGRSALRRPPLLDARADARTSYVRTLALAGDWQLPPDIRVAMRDVAVRRSSAAAGRRADHPRAARRDRIARQPRLADAAADRPAALRGGRHGRRLARGGGGAQRDAHGHAGARTPGSTTTTC